MGSLSNNNFFFSPFISMRRTATAHQKEKKNKSIAIYIQVEMPFLDQRWEQKKKNKYN